MRESEIEKKVSNYAKTQGWLSYKFVSPSNRGVPDRIYLKAGKCIFIEFKAPKKKPTKLQDKMRTFLYMLSIILKKVKIYLSNKVYK